MGRDRQLATAALTVHPVGVKFAPFIGQISVVAVLQVRHLGFTFVLGYFFETVRLKLLYLNVHLAVYVQPVFLLSVVVEARLVTGSGWTVQVACLHDVAQVSVRLLAAHASRNLISIISRVERNVVSGALSYGHLMP